MKKAFQSVRNFWVIFQLKAPSPIQQLMPRFHEIKEIARLLIKPHLPVHQLKGQGIGGPLVVTHAGLEFAKPFLKDRLFIEDPAEEKVGHIPFWKPQQLAGLSSSDMVIVEATRHLICRMRWETAIVLPEYVRHMVNVQGDWQDVQNRFRKTVRKNDLRRIRKHGYEYEVVHDNQYFEEFYYKMYLPTMNNRHGDLSMPDSAYEVYQRFRHGCLFRIKRDGIWVSGGVCHSENNTLILDFVGVRNGEIELIREGALAARYHAAIHWANQNGYDAVNFLGSGPYLQSGLFQNKRKWGSTIYLPADIYRRIWIKVNNVTPAVSKFLQENPFVIIDQEENLHGLVLVDTLKSVTEKAIEGWKKRYETPGLKSLIIRPTSNFIKKSINSNVSDLIIPLHPNSIVNSE